MRQQSFESGFEPMDVRSVLALNREHETETSALDDESLRRLVARAFHVGLREGGRAAFLIALAEEAAYDNANFAWFRSRYSKFLYIDRVIVAASARGQGLARSLYEELFESARATARPVIGCEVNLEPANAASDAFHAALGFSEVGRARLKSGKLVRYLVRDNGVPTGPVL